MEYFEYAVALLILVAVVLFIVTAIFKRRPQKSGLISIIIAVPLFVLYYSDTPLAKQHLPWQARDVLSPLNRIPFGRQPDINFNSIAVPAAMIAAILLVHMLVFQRVAVRDRLQRVANPIANFFAGAVVLTLIGAILDSTYKGGWVGALVIGFVFTLVYLGIIALLAALLEVIVELARYFVVWVKRKVFAIATAITRGSSWLSSLSGRLGLTSFADKIRAETQAQEMTFADEQDSQDRALYEAYLRDRARRRRLLQGGALPPEPDDNPFGSPTASAMATEAAPPVAPESA